MSNYTLWWFVQPSHGVLFLAAIGLLLSRCRYGRVLLAGSTLALLVAAFSPLASWLVAPLEDRFAAPGEAAGRPWGVIVLAGAEQAELFEYRGSPHFNESADRLTTFAMLGRRYPDAHLIHSGGGVSNRTAATQSSTAKALLDSLLGEGRVTYEDRSRDTREAAAEVSRLLGEPARRQQWWLVTSAFHMPRAVASFRAEGMRVVAWPADFTRSGSQAFALPDPLANLRTLDWAMHEWLGLLYYRLSGRTRELFPAPGDDSPALPHLQE